MKTRLGYLGVGSMGRVHIDVFARRCAAEAEGIALFDPHEPSRSEALKLLPRARVFDSAQALIESDLDAVVISSPNYTHADYAIAALAAGKHVFAEKPVATTAADCRRMVEAARQSGCILFIAHELPYSAWFLKIRELLERGAIGTPQMVWCQEFRIPFLTKVDQWIIDERLSGGALVEKTCHHFDVMNRWAASRPKRVGAFGSKRFNHVLNIPTEVLDNASVSFEYENGVVGTLQLCMFAPHRGDDNLEMGLIGEEGLLETNCNRIRVWPRDRAKRQEEVFNLATDDGFGGRHIGLVEEHQAFLAAIRDGTRPPTDVRDSAAGTLLAIAAERAIKQGAVVEVEKS